MDNAEVKALVDETLVNTLDETIKKVDAQMVGDTLSKIVDRALLDKIADPLPGVGAETFCNTLVAMEE